MPAARPRPFPCALSIAGLDPSGGAGIAADLRAFAAAGAWGCAAAAVLTVQSAAGLVESVPVAPDLLSAQVREIFAHHDVRALKIGALGSRANVRAVERLIAWLATPIARARHSGLPIFPNALRSGLPIILDPVLLPTHGRPARPGTRTSRAGRARTRRPPHAGSSAAPRLLDRSALAALRSLAARVTLVTPNVDEAEALAGRPVRTVVEAASAARDLVRNGARAALVKGGHLGTDDSVDVLVVGERTLTLSSLRIDGVDVHGTGCVLASLVAGRLARRARDPSTEDDIVEAVRWAKRRILRGIARPLRIGDGALVISSEGLGRA